MAVESSKTNPRREVLSTGDVPELSVKEYGKNNKEKLFMMTGWPDVHACMNPIVDKFKETHHCIVACMPDFDKPDLNPDYKWGYSMEVITAMIHKAITSRTGPNDKVTIIAHDFGACFTSLYAYKHPDKVKKLVHLDCSWFNMTYTKNEMFASALFIWPYFLFNTIVFVLFAALKPFKMLDFVSWFFMLFDLIYISLFGPCWGWPMFEGYKMPKRDQWYSWGHIKLFIWPLPPHTCYPYFQMGEQGWFAGVVQDCCAQGVPTQPYLFLYGKSKRAMYHTQDLCRRIRLTKHCHVYGIENAGHNVHWDQPDTVNKLIVDFLAAP